MKKTMSVFLFVLASSSLFADELLRDKTGDFIDQTSVSFSIFTISKIRMSDPDRRNLEMVGENEHGIVEIKVDKSERFIEEIFIWSFISIDPTTLYMMSWVLRHFSSFDIMWLFRAYHELWEGERTALSTQIGANGVLTLERKWLGGTLVYLFTITQRSGSMF